MRRWLLAAAVAAAVVGTWAGAPAAVRQSDYCCVNAGLQTSYFSAAKRITARWQAAPGGVTPVEVRAGDRLGADGVVDLSSPRTVRVRAQGSAASFGAGRLAVVLDNHAGVFVQVRFTCSSAATLRSCAGGAFWSRPAHVTAAAPAPPEAGSGGSTALDIFQKGVHIKSNGTKACRDAFPPLSGIIGDLNANTAAAKTASAAGKSTAALEKRQNELLGRFKLLYDAALAACR